MTRPTISVVVPVLNDGPALAALCADLAGQRAIDLELIVVDGGSSDASVEIARLRNAYVATSAPGRARQMNTGVRHARSAWLCFVHADTRLGYDIQLADAVRAVADAGPNAAGHFALLFARRTPRRAPVFYRFLEAKSATNRAYTINGDQALVISAAYFNELGGFPVEGPPVEDQRLVARIREHGRCIVLPGRITTSARRFEAGGEWRTLARMALAMVMYRAGIERWFAARRTPLPDHGGLYRDLVALAALSAECSPRRAARACSRLAVISIDESWQIALMLSACLGRNSARRWLPAFFRTRQVRRRQLARLAAMPLSALFWFCGWAPLAVAGKLARYAHPRHSPDHD